MLFMSDLTKEYLLLFNAITSAEEALEVLRLRLIEAQRQAEELYISRAGSAEPEETVPV